MTTGKNIKKIRKEKGLTQKQLAVLIGVNQWSVNNWERGKIEPKIKHLEKIASVLNVDISLLLIGDTDKCEVDVLSYKETDLKRWLKDIDFKATATAEQVKILDELEKLPDETPRAYWMDLTKTFSIDFLVENNIRDLIHAFQDFITRGRRRKSELLNVALSMPPMENKEDVITWIGQQRKLCEWVFNRLNYGEYIRYDRSDENNKYWIGTGDTESEKTH